MTTDHRNLDQGKKDFQEKIERFNALKAVVDTLEHRIEDADVAAVVARRTGIPLSKMVTAGKDRLGNWEAFLSARVSGQRVWGSARL